MILIKKNKPYYLEVAVIDTSGNFVNGLSISYEIRESDSNTLFESGTLIEEGNAYKKEVTFTSSEQFRVFYTTPSGYENGIEKIITHDGDMTDIATILEKVIRILGLSQSNFRMTDQVYNGDGCMTSQVISIYENATDAENQVNPISRYQMTATYNANSQLIDYRVVEL